MKWLKELFKRNKTNPYSIKDSGEEFPDCTHPKATSPFTVIVFGTAIELGSSAQCKECTETYFNRFSTHCAQCLEPILPFQAVAQAWVGAKYPYTHLDCALTAGLWCGQWGEGRLITLHELNPTKYPQGFQTIVNIAATGGKPISGTIE